MRVGKCDHVGNIETDRKQYTLTLTEVNNWAGPDGVVKSKVMLVNGMPLALVAKAVVTLANTFESSRQDSGYVRSKPCIVCQDCAFNTAKPSLT